MAFIIYAIAFRLAIIVAGVIFMYFGYKLFLRGIMPPEGTGIDGQAGEVKLTVKNAAPGTLFSLFGAVLIGIMLWQGMPEYSATVASAAGDTSEIRMRGGPGSQTRFDLSTELRASGDPQDQVSRNAARLTNGAQSLNDAHPALLGLATAYLRQGRTDEAIALVRLVYQFSGDDAQALALMGHIERARGDAGAVQKIVARLRERHPESIDLINGLEVE